MNESHESTPPEAPKPRRKAKRKVTPKKKSAPKKTAKKVKSAERGTSTPKRKGKVSLLNTLGQMLEISILSENGVHTQLRLSPQGKSEAVSEDQLTPYTQRLISRGYLRVVNP